VELVEQAKMFQRSLLNMLQLAEEGKGEQLEEMIGLASQARAHWRMGRKASSSRCSPPAFLDLPRSRRPAARCAAGSKSISNRVLLLAALCDGTTRVHDLLDSDDTRVMLDALRALGARACTRPALEITAWAAAPAAQRQAVPGQCRHRDAAADRGLA
jgi:hypothetical protein